MMGVFSVRTAYDLEVGRSQEGKWDGWKLIWGASSAAAS